jgi:hypothetical protein
MTFKKIGTLLFCAVILQTGLLSQNNARVLVILPDSSYIQFDYMVTRVLKHNRKSESELRSYVLELLQSAAKSKIKPIGFLTDFQELSFSSLNDSLNQYHAWVPFDIRAESKGFTEVHSNTNKTYLGRVVEENTRKKFEVFMHEHDVQYIIMINKFNTDSPRPFDQKTYFIVHYELFNKQMQKVFGGQIAEGYELKVKMNYEALLFMVRNQIQYEFDRMKLQLN